MESNKSGGFTLLEVILAIVVMTIMLGLTYTSMESILRAKKVIEDEQEIERLELVLVRRLSREFQLAYSGIPRLPPQDDLKTRYSASESMLGEEGDMPNGQPGDAITFVAISAGQVFLEDKLSNTGIVQIKYSLKEDPEREPREDYPVYSLVREEIPFERPFEKAYAKAIRFPLMDFAEGFMLEYFDVEKEVWVRVWGDEEHKDLPAMLRFSIFVRTPEGKPKKIQATVPLRAKRVQR
ncbi:MAG: prepilin-type N-terminal cleavage/methylation domain-containing protein [Bdellovibrionales bacterium]|nr:prepilin-type N-terminal cleavage/methylation domain-containing protein [Bdellovibrionales bacterium]